MRRLKNIPYRDEQGSPYPERWCVDIHLPVGDTGDCLIWLHGGGLGGGDKSDMDISGPLNTLGWSVVTANYRLLQHAPWPACIEDAAAVTAWVRGALNAHGFRCRRLFLGGFSAGAYLAAMVALDRQWLSTHGAESSLLSGVVLLSGQMTSHFAYRASIGHPVDQPLIDVAAPLWHVRRDAPPMILLVGSQDVPCRPEENCFMLAAMRQVGHQAVSCHIIDGHTHDTIGQGLHNPDDAVTRLIHDFLKNA